MAQARSTNIAALKSGASEFDRLMDQPIRGAFDPDAWHAMQERDEALIRDQVLHGYVSGDYVYAFLIKGTLVTGVSVVGARELASQYKGIQQRIVATIEKRGALFIFRTFDPLVIHTETLHDLAGEDDFYECVMEVKDLKTGNSVQVRKKETKLERRSNGSTYERPHYDVIAESKGFRNGVLSIIPQGVIAQFERTALQRALPALLAKDKNIGKAVEQYLAQLAEQASAVGAEKTIDQLREGAIAFAARSGIALDRSAVARLTYADLYGLGNSIKGGTDAFKASALALGIVVGQESPTGGGGQGGNAGAGGTGEDVDPETGEIKRGVDIDQLKRDQQGAGERTPPADQVAAEQAGEPSERELYESAVSQIKAGDFDLARDTMRTLPEEQRNQLERMIANKEAGNAPQPRTARRTSGAKVGDVS